ncbi:MAG TPA: sensor histidine kinase [Anaerolineaceae bacterium]|nr:sensor histidine kinase [Anaerolineaceae bacterium]
MPTNFDKKNHTANVERDPRLFTWFLTLVMGVMYVFALLEKPELRQSWQLIGFTLLMIIHVFLHWQIERVLQKQKLTIAYIIVQGALGFVICWLAGNEGIIFAIFMALLGETVGIWGLSRATFLAALYYLSLGYINLRQIMTEGTNSWMLLGIIPVIIFVVIYVVLYQRQAEAREQALALAAELEKVNQQLTEYAAQVEDLTIANERQRMARELHDTLSQGLTGIILQLEAIEANLSNNHVEKARSIVLNAMGQARASLGEARKAIDDLRGNQIETLESALHLEVTHFNKVTGISCKLNIGDVPELTENIQETIIRNVAEGLTNIARHALAKNVAIDVVMESDLLVISIEDDGQGFEPKNIPSGHYGLLGIRERMRLLGGNLDIQSKPGEGTKLKMRIPV